MLHGGWPGTVAVALADQEMLLPLIVPLARPAICMLPKQVALNVPEPVVPVNDVTAQLKFVHDSARFAPACATVTQVPPSIDDVLLGVVTVLLDLKQPALSRAADDDEGKNSFHVRARFLISLYGTIYNPLLMAILKVARMGHPVLRAKALPVPKDQIASASVQRLIDDMFETMREYSGIGLAAPQVHAGLRIFVAGLRAAPVGDSVSDEEEEDMPFLTLINPEITLLSEPVSDGWEGCLSIPDIRGLVPRASEIKVQGLRPHRRAPVIRREGTAGACDSA